MRDYIDARVSAYVCGVDVDRESVYIFSTLAEMTPNAYCDVGKRQSRGTEEVWKDRVTAV